MTLRSDNQPWYKDRWPWILMAGPAIVVVAGFITLWLAIKSDDGLVTDDYYKQGMTINQSLQRDHAAGILGLHADVMKSGLGIRLLLAAEGSATLPDAITLKLVHPTQAGRDQLVKMTLEGQGFYSGNLVADIAGRWLVSIEDPLGKWRLQGDWQADSVEPLRLNAKAVK